jgi:hypothetical protein
LQPSRKNCFLETIFKVVTVARPRTLEQFAELVAVIVVRIVETAGDQSIKRLEFARAYTIAGRIIAIRALIAICSKTISLSGSE